MGAFLVVNRVCTDDDDDDDDDGVFTLLPTNSTQDMYVRVIGGIKSFQERRHIQHGHMRPVTDFNEVFFHQLQVIHTHLKLTKGAGAGHQNGAGGAVGTMDLNGYAGDAKFATFENPVERKIMQTVEALATDEGTGVLISAVARRIQGVTEEAVRCVWTRRLFSLSRRERRDVIYRELTWPKQIRRLSLLVHQRTRRESHR